MKAFCVNFLHLPIENQKYFRFFSLSFLVFLISFIGFSQEIIPPECYGGNRLLKEFIGEEMIYPQIALLEKIEGNVELSFIVGPDGQVGELTVIKKVAPEVDAEAIRIFRKLLWYPATEMGKPIAYLHEINISFKISKYQKMVKKRGYEYFNFPHQPVDSTNRVFKRKEVDVGAYPVISSLDVNISGFLTNNLQYPESAFKQSISGNVKLLFVVEPNGHISNIQVIKTLGGGCTEEAIRVVKLINWFPALKKNVAVRCFVPMEISFNLASKTVGGSVPSPGQLY